MNVKLESDRLYFLPLQEDHFDAFCVEEMDPDVMKFIRTPASTISEVRLKFKTYTDYMAISPGFGAWSVFEKDHHEQVGLMVLFHFGLNLDASNFEIGYRFNKNFWGRGYATEGMKTFLNYGFQERSLSEIYACTLPENFASKRVLTKLGFMNLGMNGIRENCETFCLKRPRP